MLAYCRRTNEGFELFLNGAASFHPCRQKRIHSLRSGHLDSTEVKALGEFLRPRSMRQRRRARSSVRGKSRALPFQARVKEIPLLTLRQRYPSRPGQIRSEYRSWPRPAEGKAVGAVPEHVVSFF